ncbi:hypothetical protein K443DRAFT_98447 [Laccaria amethystina LaAM-08-1]|uniref:Uncharacterized protein n=1 Tax=Laccaria amethystina LaAM-08-1 TaxID=1095629 RepID=A0A0C9WS60_9AGAR|nr:hypothetical protein K443DRAFT_98447 [Laccaria amethystina LaAM-08-1]
MAIEKFQSVFTKPRHPFPALFLSQRFFSVIASPPLPPLSVYCSTCYLEWTIKNKTINFLSHELAHLSPHLTFHK